MSRKGGHGHEHYIPFLSSLAVKVAHAEAVRRSEWEDPRMRLHRPAFFPNLVFQRLIFFLFSIKSIQQEPLVYAKHSKFLKDARSSSNDLPFYSILAIPSSHTSMTASP